MPPSLWVLLAVGISIFSLVGSLLLTGFVVARLPEDYFTGPQRPTGGSPALRLLKNLAGVFLVVLGILLSLPGVPGQGVLTILVGLVLLDFPGKYRLERRLMRSRPLRRVVEGIRSRSGRPPFRFPPPEEEGKGNNPS
jgi:hypothetical protein